MSEPRDDLPQNPTSVVRFSTGKSMFPFRQSKVELGAGWGHNGNRVLAGWVVFHGDEGSKNG